MPNLPEQITATVDAAADTIGPLADALMPIVGPQLAVALPWVAAGLVAALPVCVALWPVLYAIAAVIPGNLDTWALDRIGALLERLAKWMLRRDVQLVQRGALDDAGVDPSQPIDASEDKIAEAAEGAGL